MVILCINRVPIPRLELSKINPNLILGINKAASYSETKNKFREKILEVGYKIYLRAKVCLAYDILVNKTNYKGIENDYYILGDETNLAYYYTVIGDCFNLTEEVKNNPQLLYFKDPLNRNLLYIAARYGHVNICDYLINKGIPVNGIQHNGNTALHEAANYGQFNVVKLLLNYGANINIKNHFGHLPKDEAITEDIKNLLDEFETDPIIILYRSLLSKNISKKLINISHDGKIIAKKILCKLHNLPEQYKSIDIENTWITAWHGTNFKNLESIAEIGLKPPGELLRNGEEINVLDYHIARDTTVDNIPDWANAIFVSPSIFYCADPTYAKEISYKNEQYKVFIELRVKPFIYYRRESTCPNYVPKKGEPKKLEYRIAPENEKEVQVFSLTFVKNEFFEKTQKYIDGIILRKNEE